MGLFKYIIIFIAELTKCLRYIYFAMLPLLYIFYIIYIRLFLDRPPRPLFVDLSFWQTFFTLLAIFMLTLRVYFLLRKEGILPSKEPKNYMVIKFLGLLGKLNNHQTMVKVYCYRILLPKTISFALLVLKGLNFIYKLISTKKRANLFILLVEVLPRIIVLFCFLIDIFLFQQFNYFYKSLGLLLLPLFLSIFDFVLTQYYADNITPMLALISSTPHTSPDLKGYDEFCFVNPDRIPDFIHGIDDFIENHFLPIYRIRIFIVNLNAVKAEYYSCKLQIIISLLYLMGWSTILFFGIHV